MMINYSFSFKKYFHLFFLRLFSVSGAQKKFTGVLDAGHGGSDHGANRYYSETGTLREKDVTLSVVLKVGRMLEKNKDEKYVPQIDYSKSINEQKLLKDTRVILSLIYRDYICTKEEREEIDERDRKEMRKKEREAQIKYSYDNLFKKKNKAEKANSINEEINTKVVEYKENIWSRMIKFIKKLWHRN